MQEKKDWKKLIPEIFFGINEVFAYNGLWVIFTLQLVMNMLFLAMVPLIVKDVNLTNWFQMMNLYGWVYAVTIFCVSIWCAKYAYDYFKKQKELKAMEDCGTKFLVGSTHITAVAKNGKTIGTIGCKDCISKLKAALEEAEKEWSKQ